MIALNFTTGLLDSRITLTRTTGTSNPATYTNTSGVVTAATNDQPRFDYDPVTLACRGLLIEESRTNLILYSQEFENTYWTKNSSSIVQDTAVSPDGTQNADKLVETAVTGAHNVVAGLTVTSGVTYTVSVFMKKAERGFALIAGVLGFPTTAIQINLTTGAVSTGTGTPLNAFSQNCGNGWFRVGFSITATSTGTAQFIFYSSTDGIWANRAYAGDGTSGIYIWGAQLEAGAFATSYIPTTTTTLTRNADVANITGTAFSGFWRSGPGSILVRALPSTVSGTRPLVQVDDATADNIIALRGNTTNPELYIRAGGSDQATIDAGTISAAAYRLAGAWQAGSAAASLNSGLAVNGAPASIPAPTQMRLGSDGTNYLNGHLQAVQYWPVRLSNASLQNASSTAGYQSIIHPVSRDTII